MKIPRFVLPEGKQVFLIMKNNILGKEYDLSIVLVNKATSQKINRTYRNKNNPTNILSFQLTKKSGEIILCPSVIKFEAKNKFNRSFEEFFNFLVIHGLLHLKGMQHSSRMERVEKEYDQKYFHRNRRGIFDDQSGRGRVSKRRKKS